MSEAIPVLDQYFPPLYKHFKWLRIEDSYFKMKLLLE